jgi:WD40 repeat protein
MPARVTWIAVLAGLLSTATLSADDRTVWKHDGGSYERVGDKKWVEKTGADTFEFSELSGSDKEVKLYDRKRKVRVTLRADVALIFDNDNQAKPREVKGGWVELAKPAAERVVWKHTGGTFEKTGDRAWVEKRGADTFPLRETFSSSEQVELFDPKRNARVTLRAGSASVQEGKEKEPRTLQGDWVAKADAAAPKPAAAVERVLWKHDKGQFEKADAGGWVESVSGRRVNWQEKATTPEHVELYDPAGKRSVRLAAKEATQKPDDEKAFRPWTAGGWVAKEVDPKQPKPSARFTELAVLQPEKRDSVPAFSPDGKQVARSTGEALKEKFAVLDPTTGRPAHEWPVPMYVNTAAWSADGKTLAGVVDGGGKVVRRVVLWDAARWQVKAEFELFGMDDTAFALSGDGKFVAASGLAGALKREAVVWDVARKREVLRVKLGGRDAPALALSGDGKVFATNRHGKDGDEVGVYDVSSGKPIGAVKAGPPFALSPDGGTLAAWTAADEKAGTVLNLWEVKGLAKEPRVLKDEKWAVAGVAFADAGRKLVAGVSETGGQARPVGVRVYDVKSLEAGDTFTFGKADHDPGPRVWVTPDSSRLLTLSHDRVLRVWGTSFGKK